jgi:hypothetical protein
MFSVTVAYAAPPTDTPTPTITPTYTLPPLFTLPPTSALPLFTPFCGQCHENLQPESARALPHPPPISMVSKPDLDENPVETKETK